MTPEQRKQTWEDLPNRFKKACPWGLWKRMLIANNNNVDATKNQISILISSKADNQ